MNTIGQWADQRNVLPLVALLDLASSIITASSLDMS